MDKVETVNRLASTLTPEEIENLTDEEAMDMAMERPGHRGTFGFMFHPRYFRSDQHFAETMYRMMQRLGKVKHVEEKRTEQSHPTAEQTITPEEFVKIRDAALEAARKRIREGGDPEKQKTCPHSFDSLIGDLLHGPCVCAECGKVIAKG